MSDRFTIGSVIVIEKLETSGAGELYRGRQSALERDVMLRKLPRDLLQNPGLVDHFHRQARFGAAVVHPNVVQVHDCFAYRGDHYLVMEWVDGLDLEKALSLGESMPPGVARCIAAAIARGLAELHAHAIVHGGVRPATVLLSRWGEVKLSGLGHARRVGEPEAPPPQAADRYTAPELVRGEVPGPAADVFALGTVLAELCEHAPPDRRGGVRRRGLLSLARRCRAPELARRPSAREVVGELERGLLGESPGDRRAELAAWLWERGILRPEPLRAGNSEPIEAPELFDPGRAEPSTRVSAQAILGEAGLRLAALGRAAIERAARIRVLRRPVSGVAAGAVAVGLVAYLASGSDPQPDGDRAEVPTPSVSAAPPAEGGNPALVGFVAHPWAEVRVEGRAPFLTPRAEPLELEAGSYEVVFDHPTYGVVRRNVRVRAGDQVVVRHVFPKALEPP